MNSDNDDFISLDDLDDILDIDSETNNLDIDSETDNEFREMIDRRDKIASSLNEEDVLRIVAQNILTNNEYPTAIKLEQLLTTIPEISELKQIIDDVYHDRQISRSEYRTLVGLLDNNSESEIHQVIHNVLLHDRISIQTKLELLLICVPEFDDLITRIGDELEKDHIGEDDYNYIIDCLWKRRNNRRN